jgi:hypothetical protein
MPEHAPGIQSGNILDCRIKSGNDEILFMAG